jgi:methyltransferase-like protein 6
MPRERRKHDTQAMLCNVEQTPERRSDGTLAYFFEREDLVQRCCAAGFVPIESKYVCVKNLNRKEGIEMHRVFVQGRFRKPDL